MMYNMKIAINKHCKEQKSKVKFMIENLGLVFNCDEKVITVQCEEKEMLLEVTQLLRNTCYGLNIKEYNEL